jgi:hypothetical protein
LKQFAFLVGLIIGQTAPMVLVFYLLGSAGMRALGFDFLVLVVGLIWLIRRPSLAPVIILIAYESLTLLLVIQQTFVGTSWVAPGVAPILFKAATLVTLLFAFQAIMKKRAALTRPEKTT